MAIDQEQSVTSHLEELRKRIIWSVVIVVVFFFAAFKLVKPLIHFLKSDLEDLGIGLNAFNVADPLMLYLNLAFVIALVLASPFWMYQLWAFIRPGLFQKEQRATLTYIPVIFFLFLGGVAFAYFWLLPFLLGISTELGEELGINQVIGVENYFGFLLRLTIPFGLLFQLPVVTMFLTRLGLITPQFMRKNRKYAYFALFVIAALISPPDLTSHFMVSVPLFLLYEISILISGRTYKKVLIAEREAEIARQTDMMRELNT
ncbi:twin-arginine translocase subunit TatC [Exiguobacterium flavidum]|uniref:twin-arginine translocase subunit TatC n=1 Tax=Exiguobacterium flavidum TaxID=2184695 RepID=UPI000DF7E6DF|nr:twin-arginine translocase subunit TatC [Exiguobacterium flavidum]